MVEKLQIGPYSLTLLSLYSGPLLEVKDGAETEALALLLNHAVETPESKIAEAIEAGKEVNDSSVFVSPPADSNDAHSLCLAWEARTSEHLEPMNVVHVGMTDSGVTLPVSWVALRAGLTELKSIRAKWRPEPGPWLFVRPSRSLFTTPEDYKVIRNLEEELTTIDDLVFQAEVGCEPGSLIERRRSFLTACQEAGVFSPENDLIREQWLDLWFANRLLTLRRAAFQLKAWGFWGENKVLLKSRVCLDYVRLELWPQGEEGAQWAQSALKLIRAKETGDQGVILERVGDSTVRVWWRRDGELPALLAIARG